MPQRVDRLHGGVAQREAGLHDALGDAAGKVVLEERQALLEHVAVVLPADQVGQAGVDDLVHKDVVQAEEDRAQQQRHHGHPQQLVAMPAEELRAWRGLCHVDQAAEEAEQRHLDQRADQAHQQQQREHAPHFTQVPGIEAQDLARRLAVGHVSEGVDQSFQATQHGRVPVVCHGTPIHPCGIPGGACGGSDAT
ncbi:hypothetical protein D3C72_1510170 [compost metagenome]